MTEHKWSFTPPQLLMWKSDHLVRPDCSLCHLFCSPQCSIEPASVLWLALCARTQTSVTLGLFTGDTERGRGGIKGKPIGLHMQPERKRGSAQWGEHKRHSKSCPPSPCGARKYSRVDESVKVRHSMFNISDPIFSLPPFSYSSGFSMERCIKNSPHWCGTAHLLECHNQWANNKLPHRGVIFLSADLVFRESKSTSDMNRIRLICDAALYLSY